MFKQKLFLALSATLVFAILFLPSPAVASALDVQTICLDNGGTWVGANSMTGTCTYPSGNAVAVANCGSGFSFEQTFVSNTLTDSNCIADPVTDSGGGTSKTTSDEDNGEDSLCLGSGKNGCVYFNDGTCDYNCSIAPNLPAAASNALPSDAIATLYVRVVDEGGTPGTGGYTVCFDNPSNATLTLYRFVSGSWIALVTSSSNPICAAAAGDGAFYLGS